MVLSEILHSPFHATLVLDHVIFDGYPYLALAWTEVQTHPWILTLKNANAYVHLNKLITVLLQVTIKNKYLNAL